MSPIDRKDSDTEFERDLEHIRRLYSSTGDENPPELVDQAVLNMARHAVEDGEQSSGSRWSQFMAFSTGPRWIGGLATAAVVVLAVSLLFQQESLGPDSQVVPQFEPNATLDNLTGARQKVDRDESRAAEDSELGAEHAGRYRDQAGTTDAVMDTASERRFHNDALRMDAPAEEQLLDEKVESFSEREEIPSPDSATFGASAVPPAPAESNEVAPATEFDELSDMRQGEFEPAGPAYRSNPEAWIRQLEKLREDGKLEELTSEFEAFRAEYPDYPLPAKLQSLLESR